MKGLLLNEFLTMRKVIAMYLGILILYYAFGVFGRGMAGVQIFAVFFSAMLVIYSFSYEEKSGWISYVNVLPVSRAQVVLSKYILSLIAMGAAAGGGALIQTIMNLKSHVRLDNGLWVSIMAFCVASFFLSLIIPILFKMGAEKCRIILVVIFLIPFMTIMLIEKTGVEPAFTIQDLIAMTPLIVLCAVIFMILSCMLTLRIYSKKEF
ncbi:ABC-2 transporter permease [Qiania dongpingensis]|uniref:ABC-2 transporter permease n=1 Tax=Qiania dongpingensis TaxID=2763669 RepID=A0A7G9G7L9_9FIRM|nr:ABC-2 transporter permease [Qiania dongpingensis]QNM06801.1 ABC-2 transporter permease [Qiania dongpingensis]